MSLKQKMLFWTLLAGIIAFSITIQSLLFLNWDVASLLHAAKVMMAGGVYAHDIFTPNTPTILYLYVPPIFFSEITSINIIYIFKAYIYLLCVLSLYMSHGLIKRYYGESDRYVSGLFTLILAFSYLVLPTYEFGNRDHLLVVFIMPYLLVVADRLRGIHVDKYYALGIGLFAGIGFAIKPHFLVTLVLVELYYLYRKKQLIESLRPETAGIALVLFLYAIILLTLHQNYLLIIMPFMLSNYYSAIGTSLTALTIYPLTLLCYMAIALSVVMRRNKNQDILFNVLLAALVGLLASVYLQRTLFYYHFVPALSVALILTVMQVVRLAENTAEQFNEIIKLFILAAVFVSVDVYYHYNSWRFLIYYPWYFYAAFAVMFASLLYINNKSILSVINRTLFISLAGAMCSVLLLDSGHFNHRFLIVLCSMGLMYVLLSSNIKRHMIWQTLIATMVIAMFYVPAMLQYELYLGPREYKTGALVKLADFINSRPEKQLIYVFSPAIYYTFPVVFYSNAVSAQRFDQLWPVMRFAKTPTFANLKDASVYQKSKKEFIAMVAEDLRKNKPDLIMIDEVNAKRFKFDYVTLFSENPEFINEWKSYRYLTTLHLGNMNYVDTSVPVYERIKTKEKS